MSRRESLTQNSAPKKSLLQEHPRCCIEEDTKEVTLCVFQLSEQLVFAISVVLFALSYGSRPSMNGIGFNLVNVSVNIFLGRSVWLIWSIRPASRRELEASLRNLGK